MAFLFLHLFFEFLFYFFWVGIFILSLQLFNDLSNCLFPTQQLRQSMCHVLVCGGVCSFSFFSYIHIFFLATFHNVMMKFPQHPSLFLRRLFILTCAGRLHSVTPQKFALLVLLTLCIALSFGSYVSLSLSSVCVPFVKRQQNCWHNNDYTPH